MFARFAVEHFGTDTAQQITQAHLEAFIEDQLARWKPTTASVRHRGLQQLFKWLLDEGEIEADPMARMRPPLVPEVPAPVVPDDQPQRL